METLKTLKEMFKGQWVIFIICLFWLNSFLKINLPDQAKEVLFSFAAVGAIALLLWWPSQKEGLVKWLEKLSVLLSIFFFALLIHTGRLTIYDIGGMILTVGIACVAVLLLCFLAEGLATTVDI